MGQAIINAQYVAVMVFLTIFQLVLLHVQMASMGNLYLIDTVLYVIVHAKFVLVLDLINVQNVYKDSS